MSDADFSRYLRQVGGGGVLEAAEAADAFGFIMDGSAGEIEMAAFLAAMAARKPRLSEIEGAVTAVRARMKSITAPPLALDLCGTGGDGHGTLNISTAVSFILAGMGIPVAKHGNRAASSLSGAADVLEALGVKIDLEPAQAQRVLDQTGLVFLFAQTYHPAWRHVSGVRRALRFRTIFNLLGPMASPARVKRQLVGIFAEEWLMPYAEALKALGTERAMIVHGADGLDELTTTGQTFVATLINGNISRSIIVPEDAGLKHASLADIKGGDGKHNAEALKALLAGARGAYRDIVMLNAGAAFMVAERATTIREGAELAARALDSGAAQTKLAELIAASQANIS